MAMTSSADPAKMKDYAQRFAPSTDPLRTKARDVAEAVASWNRTQTGYAYARITYVPQLDGSYGQRLTGLIADLHHLDEFVDDVADGFIAATRQGTSVQEGRLRIVSDSTLANLVGYADRQEATAAGRQAALDLQRMIDRGLRPADVETMLARGRHDPAFAVAFSEQLGVRGYVNAVGAIRMSYGEQNKVPVGGVRAAQALATTLTTALGTRVPPATPGGRAPVPDGDAHIGARFVGDLTGDFDPLGYRGHESGAKYVGPDAETDMSVLLRLSNPPPDIARQIGERRFRTILARTAERNPALAEALRGAGEGANRGYAKLPDTKLPTTSGTIGSNVGAALAALLGVLAAKKPPLGLNDNYVMAGGAYRGWGNAAATGTGPELDRPDLGGVLTNYGELLKRYPGLRTK
jgi:hypothetical protein